MLTRVFTDKICNPNSSSGSTENPWLTSPIGKSKRGFSKWGLKVLVHDCLQLSSFLTKVPSLERGPKGHKCEQPRPSNPFFYRFPCFSRFPILRVFWGCFPFFSKDLVFSFLFQGFEGFREEKNPCFLFRGLPCFHGVRGSGNSRRWCANCRECRLSRKKLANRSHSHFPS